MKFTTVYMPLVRTPMIAPTDIYEAFPTLTPEEAAQMLVRRDDRQAEADGLAARHLRRGALRGLAEDGGHRPQHRLQPVPRLEGREEEGQDGKDGDKKALPADQKKDDGEMSTEAVAMAYLLRGVHF